MKNLNLLEPLASERHLQRKFGLNFNPEIRRDHRKKSYERRVYESVEDGRLS